MSDRFVTRFAPGTFYSPIPDYSDVERRHSVIFAETLKEPSGVDLRLSSQRALLAELRDTHTDLLPGPEDEKKNSTRFSNENNFFNGKDAAVLGCLISKLRPQRVIEIGSGYSSALLLDINDALADGGMDLTFIDPEPQRLMRLMRADDARRCTVINKTVQDVDPAIFDDLSDGDILFIDSSHVSKIGSDVNFELFEILPRLAPGVWVHIHDVFYPFEYPPHWIKEGRAWNEAYMLRSFLQFNSAFAIELFVSMLWKMHPEEFGSHWLLSSPTGGRGSIWLRRVA